MWSVDSKEEADGLQHGCPIRVVDQNGRAVATYSNGMTFLKEDHARLIAAAPSLLRACSNALAAHEAEEDYGGRVYTNDSELRAAIELTKTKSDSVA